MYTFIYSTNTTYVLTRLQQMSAYSAWQWIPHPPLMEAIVLLLLLLPAWRAAQVGAGVPVSLERQPTTKAPKT